MILPDSKNKYRNKTSEKQQKNLPELLATILVGVSVFIFFIKILFL